MVDQVKFVKHKQRGEMFLIFLLIINLVKIDALELKLFLKNREVISIMMMSWGNLSLHHSHLNHQICISFRI